MILRFLRSLIADDPNPTHSRLDRLDGLPRIVQPAFVPTATARVIPVSSAAGIQSWINRQESK